MILEKIRDGGPGGYRPARTEQRTISSLAERKLVRRGAKDPDGRSYYLLTRAGKKALPASATAGAAADPGIGPALGSPVAHRLIRVSARAAEVLGTADKAVGWMTDANRALGGTAPLALLATEDGARRVEDVLGRIEFGVYS